MSDITITKNEFVMDGGKQTVYQLIIQTAIKVHNVAVALAPFDKGALRNSIMYKVNKPGGGIEDGLFNSLSGEGAPQDARLTSIPGDSEGLVGSGMGYAIYQEFGTKNMPAQPYLRPAGERIKGASAKEIGVKYGRQAMEEAYRKRRKKVLS